MTAKNQFKIALYFFMAIALLGLILRMVPVFSIVINFSNFLHAHSHVAFLGWLHGAFISFVSYIFLKDKLHSKYFQFIYWFTIANVFGMYFSFPIQGYKFFSILFLSLFLVSTYLFLHYFFKHKKDVDLYPATYKFIKGGLWLQFLSSLSPWSLVFIIKLFGKKSAFYKFDIFYYLHFQYNGWFLFAFIGLTMYLLERRNITICATKVKQIYQLLMIAVFFGYFYNTLWDQPGYLYNGLSIIGGAAEIVALFILLKILQQYYHYLQHSISDFSYKILTIVLITLFVKAVLQFMGSFQYYADLSYHIRDFIIGYLHIITLGIFTPFLLVLASELAFINLNKKAFYTFFSGYLFIEALLFLRGTLTWFKIENNGDLFNKALFLFTLWMFIGIIWMGINSKQKKNEL
jgi:hypothetical protein